MFKFFQTDNQSRKLSGLIISLKKFKHALNFSFGEHIVKIYSFKNIIALS